MLPYGSQKLGRNCHLKNIWWGHIWQTLNYTHVEIVGFSVEREIFYHGSQTPNWDQMLIQMVSY
jgi:hypothetical protein